MDSRKSHDLLQKEPLIHDPPYRHLGRMIPNGITGMKYSESIVFTANSRKR